MKVKKLFISAISFLLCAAMLLSFSGCGEIKADDLMDGIAPQSVDGVDGFESDADTLTDFAVRLLRASASEKNALVSPLSVLCALCLTVNGAEGETRAQMEAALGMTAEELNEYFYSYLSSLPQGEKYKLSVANSIWFTDDARFTVNEEFLQTNADYYGADIYKAPFDSGTLRDINNWIKDATDGMIPKMLDALSGDAVMYLINALAFEAEWSDIYEKNQVRDGTFTTENGDKRDVELMYSTEGVYLEDDNAEGFIKYYSGRKYAFAALLPDEGVTVSEYLETLDGAKLRGLLVPTVGCSASDMEYVTVRAAIPKFETEYSAELSGLLADMGMTDAFDSELADFSGLGTSTGGNISISRVLHKTYISVGEKGTKAGAATVVEMTDGASDFAGKVKEVYLDRPFVYMLIDCETYLPFFIGTMMDVNG